MDNLTPAQKIRLQLEKSLTQDAIARAKKIKREQSASAILPTFMGENGKIRRLGQGESRAEIVPNLYYAPNEEMRLIPVRGGLPMIDNKSLIAVPITQIVEAPPSDFNLTFTTNAGSFEYIKDGNPASISVSASFVWGLPSGIFDQDGYDTVVAGYPIDQTDPNGANTLLETDPPNYLWRFSFTVSGGSTEIDGQFSINLEMPDAPDDYILPVDIEYYLSINGDDSNNTALSMELNNNNYSISTDIVSAPLATTEVILYAKIRKTGNANWFDFT